MGSESTFIGELEVSAGVEPTADFADFENLTNVALIRKVASEFSDQLELMPYQRAGEDMQLAVSVYLSPKSSPGRIIAVLARRSFPHSKQMLIALVKEARERLDLLRKISSRFEEASLGSARESLAKVLSELTSA
jgi:hypothetical protein